MTVIPFTPDMLAESKRLAAQMGPIKNSILKGAGNRAGFLAELALAQYLGAEKVNNSNFDLIWCGKTIEVKTKRRTADPKPDYEGSVAITSEHQRPSLYAFLSLTFDKKIGKNYSQLKDIWFCGIIPYDEFIEKSTLYKKGQIDKSNGFIVLTDMRNIKYDDLHIYSDGESF